MAVFILLHSILAVLFQLMVLFFYRLKKRLVVELRSDCVFFSFVFHFLFLDLFVLFCLLFSKIRALTLMLVVSSFVISLLHLICFMHITCFPCFVIVIYTHALVLWGFKVLLKQ